MDAIEFELVDEDRPELARLERSHARTGETGATSAPSGQLRLSPSGRSSWAMELEPSVTGDKSVFAPNSSLASRGDPSLDSRHDCKGASETTVDGADEDCSVSFAECDLRNYLAEYRPAPPVGLTNVKSRAEAALVAGDCA